MRFYRQISWQSAFIFFFFFSNSFCKLLFHVIFILVALNLIQRYKAKTVSAFRIVRTNLTATSVLLIRIESTIYVWTRSKSNFWHESNTIAVSDLNKMTKFSRNVKMILTFSWIRSASIAKSSSARLRRRRAWNFTWKEFEFENLYSDSLWLSWLKYETETLKCVENWNAIYQRMQYINEYIIWITNDKRRTRSRWKINNLI